MTSRTTRSTYQPYMLDEGSDRGPVTLGRGAALSLADLGPLLAGLVAEEPGPAMAIPRRIALEIGIALGRSCWSSTIA